LLLVNNQSSNSSTVDVNVLISVATGDELTHLIELVDRRNPRGERLGHLGQHDDRDSDGSWRRRWCP